MIYCVIFEIITHKSALLHAVWKMVQRYLIRVVVSDIVAFCFFSEDKASVVGLLQRHNLYVLIKGQCVS